MPSNSLAGFSFPSVNFRVPESETTKLIDQMLARNAQRVQQQSGLAGQLSLLRTLKLLGLMNGFTDPVTGEFIRTPGQKLTEKQQKEYLEQKHQREARQAVLNNEALFARLREAKNLSAEKRLKNLQDIKTSDIDPIAKQFGVKTSDVYKGLFGELEKEYSQAKKDVEAASGLGSLWKEARIVGGDIVEAGRSLVSDWSDQERIARARQWNQERQAIIESDPYLADQAKREAEGENYFERGAGTTGSYLTNIARTALGIGPYVGAAVGGSLVGGPVGGVAAPFALGATQGSFGLAQRAAADPTLTQQQQEEAVSTLPRLATGAWTGTMSAIPLNLGKLAGAVVGRGAARRAVQASMPTATKETIAREIPDYMAAQRAAYAQQYPVRNMLKQGALTLGEVEAMTAGDVLGRNAIYNMATGGDTPVTAGLGEAMMQGAVAALPFGAARYRFQRPVMPEQYRAEGGRGIRKLTVDEYAERIRNQYKTDPTNNAAMTSILSAARQDLGNASFDGLMGRVLNQPGMRDLSPETVRQWNRLFNVGRTDAQRTATGGVRSVENDAIPGLPPEKTATGKVKTAPEQMTEAQRLSESINDTLRVAAKRSKIDKTGAKIIAEGGSEAEALEAQGRLFGQNGGPLDKILARLDAVDIPTTKAALNKLEAHIDTLPKNAETTPAFNILREAIRQRRLILPEQTSEPVIDATGRKIADSFNVKPAEERGTDAGLEQPADSVGRDGQATAARAGAEDTTISGRVATDTKGAAATAADGTPLQDTGAGAAVEGGGVSRPTTPDIGAREGADVSGEAAGTPAAERGADTGRGAGEVSGDEAAGAGARKPTDTGLGDADGAEPTESTSRNLSDDDIVIQQRTSISPDAEFTRLNGLIDAKSDLMFDGAVGGYKGKNTAAAKRQYVAELMEGLYRTALKPDEMLPSQLRWKVSKYLVANKGMNPISDGMAEGIHKLWNNADGISEREYLLNTLRDPDEQRSRILENVKCQMVIARRAVK